MPDTIKTTKKQRKRKTPSFQKLTQPMNDILPNISPLHARGNKPLQMTFEDQLNALIYFHLEEHSSGRHLLQALEEDDFAREQIAPREGIKKSSFFEALNNRGLEQLLEVFQGLQKEAAGILPFEHAELGGLGAIGGSVLD